MILIEENIKNTLAIEAEAIKSMGEDLDYKVVAEVVSLLSNIKGKLIVTGAGTSGVTAKKLVHTFSCINIPTVYLNPSDAVHGALGIVQERDVVILISKGGNTTEVVNLLPSLEEKNATLIAVGENVESKVGEMADLFLKINTEKEPDPFNMMATASTLSMISCFDAIAIEVMKETGFTKEEFSINHPGGAVGERLKSEVK